MLHRGLDRSNGRERSRRRGGAIPSSAIAFAGVTILALAFSFLYLRQTTSLRDLTARCASATRDLVRVEEVNRTLEFRIGQAFSLERVSQIAREQLGMVEPTVIRYVPIPASIG